MTNPDIKLPLALIAGPTASGKTALALHLAKLHKITIINADSAQVYAALPVLSAQPTAEEMTSAPHRLFGYMDGSMPSSAALWAADAKKEITTAHETGRVPMLVGGTGLYIRTLLNGIAPIPEIDPQIRQTVRSLTVEEAFSRLCKVDRQVSENLAPTDSSRIRRALEVKLSTKISIADWRIRLEGGILNDVDLHPLLLLPPRDWLHDRCNRRFVKMMEGGAMSEVSALMARELPSDAPVMRAIGVSEIRAMLKGEISREQAISLGQAATRQYAKRQYTWFHNQSPDTWPRWSEEVNDSNIDKIETLFQHF